MKPEREADCEFCGYLIVWVLVVSLVFWATVALGQTFSTTDREGNTVVLHDLECPERGFLSTWRKADLRYKGKDYRACWMAVGGSVVILDEAGDVMTVPINNFRRMAEG